MKKLTKKQIKENRIAEIKKELISLLENNNHIVYTKLLHVSRSGMMRSLDLILEDGTCITDEVTELLEYKWHGNTGGLKVTGCGMDMGFSVVYDLSCKLYCDENYERDLAYKLNHKWF